ncbi:MAG: NTP transferase domain-containing protein [candidate division WOR-3 bacterium]
MNVIILAAGIGKRMKSKIPKVLHPILGRPLIRFTFELAHSLNPQKIILVVPRKFSALKRCIGIKGVTYVIQDPPLGTGDAVRKGIASLNYGSTLILSGDVPLLKKETISALIDFHRDHISDLTIVCARLTNPYGYGRVLKRRDGQIKCIIEETDADKQTKKIKLVNGGIYLANIQPLKQALAKIKPDNKQGEYYLTDAVKIMIKMRNRVFPFTVDDPTEVLGINSKWDLAQVRNIIKERYYMKLTREGVFIEDPLSTTIDLDVKIGSGVTIRPHTVIEGKSVIGNNSMIGPFVWIKDRRVKDNSVISFKKLI